MSIRVSPSLRRGHSEVLPWMGIERYPVSTKLISGMCQLRPGYDHLRGMRPQRPLRAIGITSTAPLVLYNRMDQILQIEKALATQRVERQIEAALMQLALGIRNAEDFLEKHWMHQETRPSLHTLWYQEEVGLREHPHLLATLGAHHLVPLFSLLAHDVERGKMSLAQAEEVYEELMDNSVAQPKIVQRELANQMIRAYCLQDDYRGAMTVVEEMRRKGIRRTFVTYAPLFRMIRKTLDVERQIELLQYMRQVEGGWLPKFLFIDLPRMLYMFGVFIRYNWAVINVCFIMAITVMGLFLFNFGVLIL